MGDAGSTRTGSRTGSQPKRASIIRSAPVAMVPARWRNAGGRVISPPDEWPSASMRHEDVDIMANLLREIVLEGKQSCSDPGPAGSGASRRTRRGPGALSADSFSRREANARFRRDGGPPAHASMILTRCGITAQQVGGEGRRRRRHEPGDPDWGPGWQMP